MESVELDIDDVETEEQFVGIIKNIYPSGVYIYAIIHKGDQDSLHHLSNNSAKVKNLNSTFSIFPSKLAGYIEDKDYRFVYHFYQTWGLLHHLCYSFRDICVVLLF